MRMIITMMMITSSCNSMQKISHITLHHYFNVKGLLFGNPQKPWLLLYYLQLSYSLLLITPFPLSPSLILQYYFITIYVILQITQIYSVNYTEFITSLLLLSYWFHFHLIQYIYFILLFYFIFFQDATMVTLASSFLCFSYYQFSAFFDKM